MIKIRRTTLYAIVVVAMFTAFGGLTGLALAGSADASPSATSAHPVFQDGDPLDPQEDCGACHAEAVEAWDGSYHDEAFEAAHFQEGWEEQGMDSSCLDCHTTGFSPATGEFAVEGVSCEACHGPIPENHPQEPVDQSIAFESCEDCHPQTNEEHRSTLHEVAGLDCISCHYPHDNGLKLEDATAQCLNCHGANLEGFHHTSHIDAGLGCRDCHGWIDPEQPVPPTGLAYTGHDFVTELAACTDCHEDLELELIADGRSPEEIETLTEEAVLEGQEAILRVEQLESTIETLILEQRNDRFVNILIGSLGGMILGGVLVGIVLVNRKNLTEEEAPDDEQE